MSGDRGDRIVVDDPHAIDVDALTGCADDQVFAALPVDRMRDLAQSLYGGDFVVMHSQAPLAPVPLDHTIGALRDAGMAVVVLGQSGGQVIDALDMTPVAHDLERSRCDIPSPLREIEAALRGARMGRARPYPALPLARVIRHIDTPRQPTKRQRRRARGKAKA